MAELTVLSMGWGVQTWTLAAMMALDEIPRTDYIVFADTTHESELTYQFIREWEPWLGEHGLNTVRVQGKRTNVVREDWSDSVLIPAYTVSHKDGSNGQVRRQCTHDWKITPIRHWVREYLSENGIPLSPGVVELQMGISLDEWHRMKDSDVQYIQHRYPLVDLRMKRADCIYWLGQHALPVPPKSACTFCPYRSINSWKEQKRRGGTDWDESLEVDKAIRNKRDTQHGLLYIHSARKPLEEAVSIPEDFGARQLGLEDASCDSGYCFS